MLEKQVERRLVDKTREAGGLAMKWVSPGFAGAPDRIVFLPGGRIVLVEVKRPGEKPRPLQVRLHQMLRGLGVDVRVVDTVEAVDALVREVSR